MIGTPSRSLQSWLGARRVSDAPAKACAGCASRGWSFPELADQVFHTRAARLCPAGYLDDAQCALRACIERCLVDGLQERPDFLGRTFDNGPQAMDFVSQARGLNHCDGRVDVPVRVTRCSRGPWNDLNLGEHVPAWRRRRSVCRRPLSPRGSEGQ